MEKWQLENMEEKYLNIQKFFEDNLYKKNNSKNELYISFKFNKNYNQLFLKIIFERIENKTIFEIHFKNYIMGMNVQKSSEMVRRIILDSIDIDLNLVDIKFFNHRYSTTEISNESFNYNFTEKEIEEYNLKRQLKNF
jgi:hypothetical protein